MAKSLPMAGPDLSNTNIHKISDFLRVRYKNKDISLADLNPDTTCNDVIYSVLLSENPQRAPTIVNYGLFESIHGVERCLNGDQLIDELINIWRTVDKVTFPLKLNLRRKMDISFRQGRAVPRPRRKKGRRNSIVNHHDPHLMSDVRIDNLVAQLRSQDHRLSNISTRIGNVEQQIDDIEQQAHNDRMRSNGENYVLENYLKSSQPNAEDSKRDILTSIANYLMQIDRLSVDQDIWCNKILSLEHTIADLRAQTAKKKENDEQAKGAIKNMLSAGIRQAVTDYYSQQRNLTSLDDDIASESDKVNFKRTVIDSLYQEYNHFCLNNNQDQNRSIDIIMKGANSIKLGRHVSSKNQSVISSPASRPMGSNPPPFSQNHSCVSKKIAKTVTFNDSLVTFHGNPDDDSDTGLSSLHSDEGSVLETLV